MTIPLSLKELSIARTAFNGRQPVHGLPVRAGDQGPVDVDRDLDRRVPHLLLHVLRGLAVLQQQRGERVAIMPRPTLRLCRLVA